MTETTFCRHQSSFWIFRQERKEEEVEDGRRAEPERKPRWSTSLATGGGGAARPARPLGHVGEVRVDRRR